MLPFGSRAMAEMIRAYPSWFLRVHIACGHSHVRWSTNPRERFWQPPASTANTRLGTLLIFRAPSIRLNSGRLEVQVFEVGSEIPQETPEPRPILEVIERQASLRFPFG